MGRRFFTAIALISVSLNLLLDIRQYAHIKDTNLLSEEINRSREILSTIDQMTDAASQPDAEELPTLSEQLPDLREQVGQNQVLGSLIDQLEDVLDQPWSEPAQNMHAVQILSQMRAQEVDLLNAQIARERDENLITHERVMQANMLDIFLVSLMIFFFWYEWLNNRRTQDFLNRSIDRLRSVNELLQAADSAKSKELRTTVHDLKNPLGSIRGFAELIHNEGGSRSVVEMSEFIQNISNNTLNLVNTLLKQESVAAASPVRLEEVDVRQQLQEVCRYLRPVAALKRQKIDLQAAGADACVEGDPQRLQDAFYNLISNALKFSPPGSTVTVSCAIENETVVIRVCDQGPGFLPEDLEKIFQPGQSLSAKPTGGETSTGIGLYSAKRSIEIHSGRIAVANNADVGASSTIHLPLLKKTPRRIGPGPEGPRV